MANSVWCALAAAGLEAGEIAALRWGDIGWLHGHLTVAVALLLGPEPVLVNSGHPRTVPATWRLLAALEARRGELVAVGAGDGPCRFVFPDLDANPTGALPMGFGGPVT